MLFTQSAIYLKILHGKKFKNNKNMCLIIVTQDMLLIFTNSCDIILFEDDINNLLDNRIRYLI